MRRKFYFDPVDPKPDFPAMEKRLLEDWYKKGIVKKYLQKNKNSSKYFSFLDGPITANNPMGVHHAWGRTYKDLWQRFKNMRGFRQRFQSGFDCQGLWVEVEVEKELQFKSKKEIENFGVEKFIELCKARVRKYSQIQTEQSKRLGYFMDWDNSYYTLSDENNYMIWHFLKKCHEKGLIYKGHDVVPWCPRCETAISEHEMLTEDYKEITHQSVFVEYPLEGKENTYLIVWTTTPWTLPGNVAVAVDVKKEYVEAVGSVAGNIYILLKEAAQRLGLKIKRTFKGRELIGLRYRSPFDTLARVKESLKGYAHQVIATDALILPISSEEGTGLVHLAPGQGVEDYQLGKKNSLPVIELIDNTATYLDGLADFSGQNAKRHPEIIIDYLKKEDFLFDTLEYTHRYPACWRCKTELVWKITDEWYIAIDPIREEMKQVAKKINWIPEFGLKRELDWLSNMHDWLISKKNRYWGLALPIWECEKCKNFEVIGSRAELEQRAVAGWEKFAGHTPHKPWIDEVKIKCGKCSNVIGRIPDVGNPWLDAGIVTFSTISLDNKSQPLYLINKRQWRKWAPVDFITESFPGQFKNWFYSLIAMSTVLEKMEPFKSVLGFATLFGEDGRPMHKSWGNSIEFNEGADKIGVDVMRWMYARQNPADNLLFGYKIADEVRRKFHLKLWNIYNFFTTYANLDKWQPNQSLVIKNQSLTSLDRWILARLNQVIKQVTENLENYDAFNASRTIEDFVDDFSLWYIRRSRDRVGPSRTSSPEQSRTFYETCYFVLVNLAKILAPFVPFLADIIYKNLTKQESVHLTEWPVAKILSDKDIRILSEMQKVREIVEKVHAVRKADKIPIRQPLKRLIIYNLELTIKGLVEILSEEVNVKEVVLKPGKGKVKIELDTLITPELEEEAKTRFLIRKIQEERKKMGMNLTQKINFRNEWLPSNRKLVQWLKKKAQIRKMTRGTFKIENA